MSSTFLIIAAVVIISCQQVLCQDDPMDSRALGAQKSMSEGTGGGQSRQLHSGGQKHFSPHRMMHFGKRPLVPMPPALPALQQFDAGDTTSDNLDGFQPLGGNQQQQQQQQKRSIAMVDEEQQRLVQQAVNEYLPYSLVYDLPRDQMLEAAPADNHMRDKHLMDIVDHLLQFSKQQKGCNTNTNNNNKRQQQESNNNNNNNNKQQEIPERMMKLINGDTDSSYELAANIEKLQQQQAEQTNGASGGGEQQLQTTGNSEQDAINLVGRSVPRSRAGEPFDLTKAHISSLLFGRRITEPPSSLMSLGSFIKKAEPQRMTFMHFG